MGAAYFYHLTQSPLEVALPELLSRSLQAGWRVELRGRDAERMDWLDQKLWLGPEAEFLAHGMAGGAHDAMQPILLTAGQAAVNGATCVMAVDGAAVEPDEVARLDRVCVLFDGNDPDAVAVARGQWKALTEASCAALYWAQEGGRWVKKAESGT